MRIVILGGGTAGWMSAVCMSRILGLRNHSVSLIESSAIPTVGVGEATIPMIEQFHRMVGITPFNLVKKTEATFKLGIEFVDWARKGHSYFHPFGFFGNDMNGINFVHYWLRHRSLGDNTPYEQYNVETLAARENKFTFQPPRTPDEPKVNFAYHFDAGLYAQMLREIAERGGVNRIDAKVQGVAHNSETGDVTALKLDSGAVVEGDLFLDCSGFRSILLGDALGVDFVDWSKYLPCNTALTAATEVHDPLPSYTKSTAKEAGWQWRIPLQHRTGNGYVYADSFTTEEQALNVFEAGLDRPLKGDIRKLKFRTGMRPRMWEKNVIALGLSAGFLEPLESTAIHLVQSALTKLMVMFPRGHTAQRTRDKFNQAMVSEYERIRDFLLAHYTVTDRDDSEFWRYCRNIERPDMLKEYLEFYEEDGVFIERPHDLFRVSSWFAVLHGQGITPKRYHPIADASDDPSLHQKMSALRARVSAKLNAMPPHAKFVESCRTAPPRPV